MITTFLIEHPWLSPTAIGLLVVLGPVLGWWTASRPRSAGAVAVLSLAPVLALTLAPTGARPYGTCEVRLDPAGLTAIEPLANVALLVAPALLLAVATRRPALGLVAGSGLSVALEVTQALVSALGRSCSTNDWLANTAGAALGAALGGVALVLHRRHPLGPATSSDPVLGARVG